MKKFITVALVSAMLSVPTAASAIRPIPGVPLADLCDNIDGTQTVYDVAGPNPDYFVQWPSNNCVRIWHECLEPGTKGFHLPCLVDGKHHRNPGASYKMKKNGSVKYLKHGIVHNLLKNKGISR